MPIGSISGELVGARLVRRISRKASRYGQVGRHRKACGPLLARQDRRVRCGGGFEFARLLRDGRPTQIRVVGRFRCWKGIPSFDSTQGFHYKRVVRIKQGDRARSRNGRLAQSPLIVFITSDNICHIKSHSRLVSSENLTG